MANSVPRKPALVDIRQIGPNSEHDISGVCSACKTILLIRVDSPKLPTSEQLEDALLKLFQRHAREAHGHVCETDATSFDSVRISDSNPISSFDGQ